MSFPCIIDPFFCRTFASLIDRTPKINTLSISIGFLTLAVSRKLQQVILIFYRKLSYAIAIAFDYTLETSSES
jgi:hypothetical protein